ncbi:MAG: DUF5615 family PIN-like protein [Verrucomicrobia bacterium]|nr:DUF5615 family PIN-like protein [Verrucomicrobiota bacterium]
MKFFLDQDVPDDVERLLGHWGHDVLRLRDALPVTTTDEAVFDFAQRQSRVLISCNRGHFLELARDALSKQSPFEGLIVLIRRRTRQAECSHLLSFLRRAGCLSRPSYRHG